MGDRWDGLVELVESQVTEAEPWQTAEWHLLERAFRERLEAAGIPVTPEAAATLMAAAVFLSAHTPEWGGHTRDTLADLAALGLHLLATPPPEA